MSIEDLNLILKKDPIITTFPAASLQTNPARVEKDYLTHAKTHISLGDTERYVDTIFKWVGGVNKGTFVGAVVGNYGEGKTDFLVHIWAQSVERKVFAVPPFEWTSVSDMLDAVAAWVDHVLCKTHPEIAKAAERVHEEFREKTLEELASQISRQTGQELENVLATLRAQVERGRRPGTELSVPDFLDYCARCAALLKQAEYNGLLVLLDEPEAAARQIGREAASHLLFNLANELHQREGDYGVFLAMPENFLADAARRFAALPARLQVRNCFPRLRDIYASSFASVLWERYIMEFDLGDTGRGIISALALQAIGQVGSSERLDLSYGPRTVVSSLSKAVDHYKRTGTSYEPEDFVNDCLVGEIMVKPDYPTVVNQILQSPEVNDSNRAAVTLLAAFPNGLSITVAKEKGIEHDLLQLSRSVSLVYRTAYNFGLNKLKKEEQGPDGDDLKDAVIDIATEFAPTPALLGSVSEAFKKYVIQLLFQPKQGWSGWSGHESWKRSQSGAWVTTLVGAFTQTQYQYPRRAVIVVVSSFDDSAEDAPIPENPPEAGPLRYDAVFQFRLRWNSTQDMPANRLELTPLEPEEEKPALIRLTIDLLDTTIQNDRLVEIVGPETLTTLWVLNLLNLMDKQSLPRMADAEWQAIRTSVLRDLIPLLLGDDVRISAEQKIGQALAGAGLELLGSVFQKVLLKRYPRYSTLMRQPQWENRVGDYITALTSDSIPLSCKRGREKWRVDATTAARLLGTSRMNLVGGAFDGFENLLVVTSTGRDAPLEISFKVHPLEQEIADLIASQRMGAAKPLKIDGIECRSLQQSDLLPLMKRSGYTVEELNKIVEIGKSRKSFGTATQKGERVLYCKPIDPEQMKSQLREKLSDLSRELEEFRKLPDFHTSINVVELQDEIDALEDEADYERLVTKVNKHFEGLHQRLPGYFDALTQRLKTVRSEVRAIADQVAGSRELASLKNMPTGKSLWCHGLIKYIHTNLKAAAQDINNEGAGLLKRIDGHIAKFVYRGVSVPAENIKLLIAGGSAAGDVEGERDTQKQHAATLIRQLKDYEAWVRLLGSSDELYSTLLDMKAEVAHRTVAEELMREYEDLSHCIADHLELRNLNGLEMHKQFAASLQEIEDKRKKYLLLLKADFDRRKASINVMLEGLQTDRVTTAFNPMDSQGCYREAYGQAAANVREAAIGQCIREVEAQGRELRYAKDILRTLEEVAVGPLLSTMGNLHKLLESFKAAVDNKWVAMVSETDDAPELAALAEALNGAKGSVRESRQILKAAMVTNPPEDTYTRNMLDLLPQAGSLDLKGLILEMLAKGADSSTVLNLSVEGLGDLFRRNCVQIKVERQRV